MGYTHHYYITYEVDGNEFAKVVVDFKKMVSPLKRIGVMLADCSGNNRPHITPTGIGFNGLGESRHEPFSLMPRFIPANASPYGRTKTKYLESCKTAWKPYDLAVTTCLVIAKHYLKNDIEVLSDGQIQDWQNAMCLCQHFLGYGEGFTLDK